jgi:hypothetical protein
MIDPTKAAERTITALSGTPMLLVLVLLNLGGLVMITYLIHTSAQLRFRERAELVTALRECTQVRR